MSKQLSKYEGGWLPPLLTSTQVKHLSYVLMKYLFPYPPESLNIGPNDEQAFPFPVTASGLRVKRQDTQAAEDETINVLCKGKGPGEWFRLNAGDSSCNTVVQCTSAVSAPIPLHTQEYRVIRHPLLLLKRRQSSHQRPEYPTMPILS